MKKIFLTIILFSLCRMLSAQTVFENRPNYDLATNSIFAEAISDEEDLGEYTVQQAMYAIDSNTGTITFDSIGGQPRTFYRTNTYTDDNGVLVWKGVGIGPSVEYRTRIVIADGQYAGYIQTGTNEYWGINSIGSGHYIFHKFSGNQDQCGSQFVVPHPYANPYPFPKVLPAITVGCEGNLPVYRLIIAYTPQFAAHFSSQAAINNYLISVIDNVNETYRNSGVNVRARLVYSFKTADNEHSDMEDNLDDLKSKKGKYNEVHDAITTYRADATVLMVSGNVGGIAFRPGDFGVVGYLSSSPNAYNNAFVTAHEIGHMFGLHHNREEVSWAERTWFGLDGKRCYGYLGTNYRTIMSYARNQNTGEPPRVGLYSDPSLLFPDNNMASDNKFAFERQWLNTNISNFFEYSDPNNEILNRTIWADNMMSIYAHQTIMATNFNTENSSRSKIRAGNYIYLAPGTNLKAGSTVTIEAINCQPSGFKPEEEEEHEVASSNSGVQFRNGNLLSKSFHVYPNPTHDVLNIEGSENGSKYFIADALGRVVAEGTVQSLKIDASQLRSGNYLLSILSVDGQKRYSKFTKE